MLEHGIAQLRQIAMLRCILASSQWTIRYRAALPLSQSMIVPQSPDLSHSARVGSGFMKSRAYDKVVALEKLLDLRSDFTASNDGIDESFAR